MGRDITCLRLQLSSQQWLAVFLRTNFHYHIDKHSDDNLLCAKFFHKEPIEIGYLMRFCREGHISFNCARKFRPKLSEKELEELHKKYTYSRKTEVTLNGEWREFIYQV